MKKILKIILIILVIGFIVIQFINRPDKTTVAETTSEDITKHMDVPANVQSILKRSCYDCHSSHTVWPWYSSVAPVSWLVADDVVKGRKKMNFSEWAKIPDAKKEARINAICEEINADEMPLPNYLIIHTDAKLSQADKDILCKWVEIEIKKMEDSEPK
jgi:hypothetical protein